MSIEHIDSRLDRVEDDVDDLKGLKTEIALSNSKVDNLCDKVSDHIEASIKRDEEIMQWAFTGTDTKDGAEVRISRLEGFRERTKKLGWWLMSLVSLVFAALFGLFISKESK